LAHRFLEIEELYILLICNLYRNDAELRKERLARVKVFVLAGPQDRFTEDEFEVLKHYVEVQGGSLLVLLGEGGEPEFNTNVNFFLEQYGI